MTCIFAMYPDYVFISGTNRSWLIAYEALSRPCWSIAIGWLLVLCSTNHGRIVNQILSWSIWSPLARLNYSAYLIHTTIIFVSLLNQRSPTYYSPSTLINTFITNLFVTYNTAMIVYIFFETPFFIIENKVLKRNK